MPCTRVGWSWNRNRGEGFVLDSHSAAARTSPLATEMAGDIHYFANKEETGELAGFPWFCWEVRRCPHRRYHRFLARKDL